MKPEHQRTRIASLETIPHDARPQPPGGAKLGDLLEQIVVRVEEERNARREIVDREAGCERGFDIGNSIGERECNFLYRSRSRFADVITADRDRVPVRHLTRAESKRVSHET